jgi:hypothetical protein
MIELIDWHRLFGITVLDYFTGSNYRVEVEKNLTLKNPLQYLQITLQGDDECSVEHKELPSVPQFLDVAIIKETKGRTMKGLPDGLDNLSKHNLMTYHSPHQVMESFSLEELLWHYVSYRKKESASLTQMLPERGFRLYAVITNYPDEMKKEKMTLKCLKEGVYEVPFFGSRTMRIIVASEVRTRENNTPWLLFSGIPEKVEFAKTHHRWRHPKASSVVHCLYERYFAEKVFMSYSLEDYFRDYQQELFENVPLEKRFTDTSLEEVLKAVTQVFSPEQVAKALPAEVANYLGRRRKSVDSG